MFADTLFNQRQHGPGGFGQPFAARLLPVFHQPRPGFGQVLEAVAHVRLLIEAIAQQACDFAWERVRNNTGAFDQPGIAMAGAGARLGAVEQDHVAPACLELQRGTDADDAGPQNDSVAMHKQILETRAVFAARKMGLLQMPSETAFDEFKAAAHDFHDHQVEHGGP